MRKNYVEINFKNRLVPQILQGIPQILQRILRNNFLILFKHDYANYINEPNL